MIELYLNDYNVIINNTQSIKLTRENAMMKTSGDYTLEVEIPLSVLVNRKFFGPWNRLDKTKDIKTYRARLYANNNCLIDGSAKVTAVTDQTVKVQLYGDKSQYNNMFGDLYIDEQKLPWVKIYGIFESGMGGTTDLLNYHSETIDKTAPSLEVTDSSWSKFVFPSVYNSAGGHMVNMFSTVRMLDGSDKPGLYYRKTPMFNLLYAIRCVFSAIGYDVDLSEYDIEPYNHIIIANCIDTLKMNTGLPHWTYKDFVEQIQYFFGSVFIFSSAEMKVKMVHNTSAEFQHTTAIDNEDTFSIDVDTDSSIEGVGISDLHYDLSDQDSHDYDYIDYKKLKSLKQKTYNSYDELLTAYETMSDAEKSQYLFVCPTGSFCLWSFEDDDDANTITKKLIRVNHFGNLIRSGNTDTDDEERNTIDLKIVPVAMSDEQQVHIFYEKEHQSFRHADIMGVGTNNDIAAYQFSMYQTVPIMDGYDFADADKDKDFNESDITTMQESIEDSSSDSSYTKPDRLEVFFYDGSVQTGLAHHYSGSQYVKDPSLGQTTPVNINLITNQPAVFTAYDYKNIQGIDHKKWSMSLNKSGDVVKSVADLHNEFTIKQESKYTVKFYSDKIPSAHDIYIIRNKQFYAEKIEIELTNDKCSHLMTGYFYEIQS